MTDDARVGRHHEPRARLGLTVVVVAALLGGCGSARYASRVAEPSASATASPVTPTQAAAEFTGGQALPDGLHVPRGARLVAAVGRTGDSGATGWYAVLEPSVADGPDRIRDGLVQEALARGYVPVVTVATDTTRLSGGTRGGGTRTVDLVSSPARSGFPAYVRVVVTESPGPAPR